MAHAGDGHDHGHDQGHDHGSEPGHGHHDAGGHAPEPPAPTPPHVFTIARITRVLGLAVMAVFAAGVFYYWLLHSPQECGRVYWSAFAFVYGFCIWRTAADTLARAGAAPGAPGVPGATSSGH